jgi:peptidoglycan/xylan/chitin deacetylase (PgdA/CDA1 family)
VNVELHTHRHRVPLDHALFVREIEDNRRRIREVAPRGAGAVHFCYPSGVYDRRFLPWLRETGVRSATTCVPGLSSAASDPLLLPRFVDTSLQSPLGFEGWASGFAALLPRRGAQL